MRYALLVIMALVAIPAAAREAVNPSAFNPTSVPTRHYRLDPDHASVVARVRYMGLLQYTMRFSRIDGRCDIDPANPAASRLSVAVDARSFDDAGDTAARQAASEILDADRYPSVTFNASAIRFGGAGRAALTGELTLRGVTKPVTFEVTSTRADAPLESNRPLAYSATTVIRRSDFGSRSWPAMIGDKIQLVIDARFIRE